MATIAVFGASGRTGRPFVQKALDAGYAIRALVRNPASLPISHPKLTVIQGSSLDAAKVDETVAGSEGVVSLLGQSKDSPPDLQTRSTQLILDAMRHHGLRRIISLTGGGVRDTTRDRPGFMDNAFVFVMKLAVPNVLKDGANHADLIRRTDLDWTIVRGPRLTDDPPKGAYQIGYVGTVPGFQLTRADLADFILKTYQQGTYVREMPFVTNG